MKFLYRDLTGFEDSQRNFEQLEQTLTTAYGIATFTTNVTTNSTTVAPVWDTTVGAGGGMSATSAGFVVPTLGLYWYSCSVRCDSASGAHQLTLLVNGFGYDANYSSMVPGSTTQISGLVLLPAKAALSVSFASGVAATWFGTPNWLNQFSVFQIST